jgi:hypothetical protein
MAPSAKYLLYNTATQVIILISVAKRIRQTYFSPLLDAVVTTSRMIFRIGTCCNVHSFEVRNIRAIHIATFYKNHSQ